MIPAETVINRCLGKMTGIALAHIGGFLDLGRMMYAGIVNDAYIFVDAIQGDIDGARSVIGMSAPVSIPESGICYDDEKSRFILFRPGINARPAELTQIKGKDLQRILELWGHRE